MLKVSRGKGRPQIDDREQVLAFVMGQMNAGASVTQACADGLTIYSYEHQNDGCALVPVRTLGATLLERRYREILTQQTDGFRQKTNLPAGTRYIGIQPPTLPSSLRPPRALKRGRPRKSRTR